MRLGGVFGQVAGLTDAFTPWLLLAIFLISFLSEFGIMIPLLMETVWLLSGYNVAIGIISPGYLVLSWLVMLIGRELGTGVIFYISWFGTAPLIRQYHKRIKPRISQKLVTSGLFRRVLYPLGTVAKRITSYQSHSDLSTVDDKHAVKLFGKTFRLSPFTVALSRFIWLRLPVTIALGATKQGTPLFLGVVIFSVIWDGAYILLGVLGNKGGMDPIQTILFPLGAMILISATVFGLKRLRRPVTVS